jgi:hypothetical protein
MCEWMRQRIINKLYPILTNWIFWLVLISFIAIFIRSLPAYYNPAWGADFGIYYGLTNYFIESKELFYSYDGWGNSYQYFPVLYAISGISHWITGIDLIEIMPKIAPIFGGLTITIFYFIVHGIFKDKRISLISAALLSVSTFHVYQTSHASPLTFGHFFMMLSLLFFIRSMRKKQYILPLLLSTSLLILSHHFTTYFYIISISFILFSILSENLKDKKDLYVLIYVVFTSLISFSYWAIIAKPVFYNFMENKMFISPYLIIILFYGLLFSGFFLVKLIKIYNIKFPKINYFEEISYFKKFLLFLSILLIISLYGIIEKIPGVYVKITPLAFLYSIPMIFLICLSLTGFSDLKKIDGGNIFKAWFYAIFISLIYSLISSNLYPDRHLEYLIIPLCVPAAILINNILFTNIKQINIKPNLSPLIKSLSKTSHVKKIIFILISIMCISNMIAAYPTIDSLKHIDERVTTPCVNVFDWMGGNISYNSVVASDHRLEMLLWANGYNITYGKTNTTWSSNYTINCIMELRHLNVSYILIDDIMKNSVINVDVGNYYYMTNNSYKKFLKMPFELIYRNASINNNLELHWIELYKIDYNYFDIFNIL